jgi:uncharacterized protein YbjT (DUF2867 family)
MCAMTAPTQPVVLVAGATGFLGGEICRRLVAQEKCVRAMVRPTSDPARVAHLRTLGVELVQADLKDRSSLDAACRGVQAVVSTVSTTLSRQPGDTIERVDQEGQLDLVAASRAAGVARFVYVSYPELDDWLPGGPCPLTVAKRSVERALVRSGMTYTILRPTYFMEVWLGPALGFDLAGGSVTVYGSGRNKISWIALGDVAEFAAQSLDNPAARDATLTLGGPEALSYADIIATAERLGGRAIDVQYVPVEAIQAQVRAAGESLGQSFAALTLAVTRDGAIEMRGVLARFRVPLTSVEDHVRRATRALAPAGA